MKLGVFNLWTEMRELPQSDAFEVAPLFRDSANANKRAEAAPLRAGRQTVERTTAVKKRKPVVIVDEITAS